MLDELKELGFLYATKAGISIGVDDMVIPRRKQEILEQAPATTVLEVERQRLDGAITARRAPQQDHRHLAPRHREGLRRDVQRDARAPSRSRGEFNPIFMMADSGARGSQGAGPPARRHARPDVQALGRGHRDAHHRELPRRPLGAAVLHLDARRPQGSGRHGAQDGRLRLPHAPSRRRGAGRHRHRAGLPARSTASSSRRSWKAATSSSRCATASSAASAQEDIYDPLTGEHDRLASNDEITESSANADAGSGHRAGEDPFGAHLRDAARRLPPLLRPQPGHRQDGRDRRGGRRHRRRSRSASRARSSPCVPSTSAARRRACPSSRSTMRRTPAWCSSSTSPRSTNKNGDRWSSSTVTASSDHGHADEEGPRAGALRREKERYALVYGSTLKVHDGQHVEPGTDWSTWDPFTSAILTEVGGKVEFKDIVEGENVREETDKVTGLTQMVIVESSATEKRTPADHHQGEEGRREAVPAPHRRPPHGAERPGGLPGRHPGQDPARDDQDQGHHRRSAARRRALRSPSAAQGAGIITEVDGTVHHGAGRQGHAPVIVETRRRHTPRVPRAALGPRQRAGGRARARRRSADRRPDRSARRPAGPRREGAAALPGRQDPGGLPLAVASPSTTSTSRSSCARCCGRCGEESATPTSSSTSRSIASASWKRTSRS